MRKNDNAQMMVLESILFAITVVVALAFLVQISPTAIQGSTQSTNDLKLLGDDALDAIYAETQHIKSGTGLAYVTNNPTSKLAVCIIVNDYQSIIDSLNSILPDTVLYNIYVSNGTKTVFWCTPQGVTYDTTTPQSMIDPVAVSHHPIAIDPVHLDGFPEEDNSGGALPGVEIYLDTGGVDTGESDIWEHFVDPSLPDPYEGSIYEVILEMSYIWVT